MHVTQADLDGLQQGYRLNSEQTAAIVRSEDSKFRILMDNHAACGALSTRGRRYACRAYEHRPGICRSFECYILAGAKDWMSRHGAGQDVDTSNPFHASADEEDLRRRVEAAIQRMRSDYLSACVQLQNGARGRMYEHLPELIETLSGAEFDNTFPPG